jgi:hypothetical protein
MPTNIKVEPEVLNAFDGYLSGHNAIIESLNARVPGTNGVFTSTKGLQYSVFDIEAKLQAVYYKLRYAMVSLEKLTEIHKGRLAAITEQNDFMGEKVPLTEELIFNADILFTFISSAWDLASWPIFLVHPTTIPPNQVYMRKVCENLASTLGAQYDVLRTLQAACNNGWISKFESYRNYVTHHGILPTRTSMTWSTTGGISLGVILLPDDPKAKPVTFDSGRELIYYGNEAMIMALGFIHGLYDFVAPFL